MMTMEKTHGRTAVPATAAALALAAAFGAGSFAMPAEAHATGYGSNGYHMTADHSKTSDKLVIGDSNQCIFGKTFGKKVSTVAVWGGHYGYGGARYGIDTKAQRKKMKKIARAAAKRHGRVHIYIFPSNNDWNGGSGYAAAARNVESLARTAKGWTGKADVHVMSMIASKGVSAEKYDRYLKGHLPGGVGWIGIGGCKAGKNGGYLSDGMHLNGTTNRNIWKKIA